MTVKTEKEYDECYLSFSTIAEKLELDDLKRLCHLFECYPNYVGEVRKEDCISYLWTKFRDWRTGAADSQTLRSALFTLGVRAR